MPMNCAWGALCDGPYRAAEVVNVLKTRVRMGDPEEEVESPTVMEWAVRGEYRFEQQQTAQSPDGDSSAQEVEEVTPGTPTEPAKTDK